MLKDTPTDPVVRRLGQESVRPDDLLIYTSTDIDKLGNYNQQWLAVTKDRLLVLSDGKESEILLSLKMKEVAEFRSQGAVGSGLFQARVNGYYIDVLRYSNRLADKFHKVVKKLDRYLAGEPIVIHPEDEVDARDCPTCGLTLEFPGDVCPRCVNRGAALTRMWKIMVPYRFPVLLMLALLVVGIGLDLVPPQLTRYLVDHVLVGSEEEALRIKSDPEQLRVHLRMLVIVVAVLAGAQTLRMVINILNGRLTNKVGTGITFDIRGRLVDHLQQLSVAYYDRQQVGSLVARVAYDTEALHGFISQLAGGFLFQILMVILVGIMMFSLDVRLALFTLIPAPLFISGSIVFWRYIYPRYYRFWDASSKQAGMLSGMLSGIRVVKAFSQEGRELKRFNSASDRLQRTRRDVDMSVSTFNPMMGLVFQFGGWIVWFIGGRDVLRADITLGELMAFFGYLWMFYSPLGALTQFTNWLTSFVTQAHRIFEILDTPVQISEPKKPVKVKPIRGEIRLENVSFGYNRHIPVLRNVSLEIRPGEMIGVVGQSGSGKTTIVNLIRRFYDVDEGRVTIDGVDVRSISRDDLRSGIGIVLQEPFLFRGNIWDNITYGKPEATVEEVLAASKAANCHGFIMRAAYGYDTWVGERGAGLSGGERQRVSIARALLIDPKILILDEATSNVDSESEAAIQAALAEVVRGRTTIAIAHRLSTLRNSNRILVVSRGRIVESGTHEELLSKGGQYARLVKIQGQFSTSPNIDLLEAKGARDDESGVGRKPGAPGSSPLPDPRSHRLRWLSPEIARIHRGEHGALYVTVQGESPYGGLYALRCLPVRYSSEYISLRYLGKENREIEVGLIRRIEDWPPEAGRLIRESLLKRYFVHTIRSIGRIEHFQGYLEFDVETDLGPHEFIMRWQVDRAHDYGLNGKMLIDTDENRYLIPDVRDLSEDERRMFQRFIYW